VRRALLLCAPLLAACVAACVNGAPGERLGTAEQANVCATGATLEGVDVSIYDGDVDWAQVASSGRAFGIAKATEGASLADAEFATNWPAMKSAGIVRSAYHFFHCDSDPATQASFFLGVMGPLEPGDLPPSLDFEDITTCTAQAGVSMAITWLDAVASATGTLPILYTSVNVLSNFDDTQSLAGHAQLWVASRGVTCPDLPAPFTAWSFWQYSLTGTAPGLPNSDGMADLDQFNGDMSALLALTVGGSSTSGSSSASSSGAPACTASGVAGTCIDTSVCATMPGYVSTPGLCPGPADEQCCTPAADASSGSSASSSGAGGASTSSGGAGGGPAPSTSSGGAGGGSTPSTSGSCAATPAGATTSTSVLLAALLSAGLVASRRSRRTEISSARPRRPAPPCGPPRPTAHRGRA
jgi:lysozyme